MSEYQFYEFRAVDRSLSNGDRKALRRISGHAEITDDTFTVVYNYGDFGGEPDALLAKYFDAYVYVANWGSRHLGLRLSRPLGNGSSLKRFAAARALSIRTTHRHVVVSMRCENEDLNGWTEGEGWLKRLLPVRSELERGDLRSLYLGWLAAVQLGEGDEAASKPPVPPGLERLTRAQNSLVEFFGLDEDLIREAAKVSRRVRPRGIAAVHRLELARRGEP